MNMKIKSVITAILSLGLLSGCATVASKSFDECGVASWYGGYFHGRQTASGERYNMYDMTGAHKHLPFGSKVLVVTESGKETIVTINDRGPFIRGRIIDLSLTAAQEINMVNAGTKKVCIRVLE